MDLSEYILSIFNNYQLPAGSWQQSSSNIEKKGYEVFPALATDATEAGMIGVISPPDEPPGVICART